MTPWSCAKFRRLAGEKADVGLSVRDRQFYDSHLTRCERCARLQSEMEGALDLLRTGGLDSLPSSGFDRRVLRRHRVESFRQSLLEWRPALIGGAIAAFALLVALQALSRPESLPAFRGVNSEAAKTPTRSLPAFPEFDELSSAERR